MRYRELGKTGLRVSVLGFGTAPLGLSDYLGSYDPAARRSAAAAALNRALDLGINYVDTAPYYGMSEEIIGRALAGRRESFFLATKVAPALSPEETAESVEGSLRRLRTETIDVVQVHGGCETPATVKRISSCGQLDALRDLRLRGKVRFTGITGEATYGAIAAVDGGEYDVVQLRYNLLYQEADDRLLPLAKERGVGVVAMRPLTSGNLKRILETADPALLERFDWARVALSFVLSHSGIATAIVGMRTAEEVEQNVATAEDPVRFDIEDLYGRQHTSPRVRRKGGSR